MNKPVHFLAFVVTLLAWNEISSAEEKPLPWVAGSTTVAVLPDTQVYAMKFPELFEAQTKWIAENAKERNIVYVLHLGDIVNNNNPPQWEVAQRSMKLLDGVVPYAMAPGNHDYGPNGDASTRETLFNQYFPLEKFRDWPTLGGLYNEKQLDNSFHKFRIGDQDWLALCLEWGPRDEVVSWADEVLKKHPDHRAILVTHAYLYSDGTRYDHKKPERQEWNPHWYKTAQRPGGVNDGEQLWQKLVKHHKNMMFTLNGHVLHDGLGYLSSQGDHGNTVHQILSNYQMNKDGGEAYFRLMEFLPDGNTVQVKTYSPHLDQYKTDEANQFVVELKEAK